MRREFGKAARRNYTHLDGVVSSIVLLVRGGIADHIAIAQLDPDLLGDVRQLEGICFEHAGAGLFRDLVQ